ncbi:3-oxo-5-alpha-steroid 4-dehydrogenase 1 [Anolis sagrei]|uniref:3-oxo-5-alpha-steroid 4-dehydrogenase 1 n=1 Tax=Anolis sagrei TaxID=38937 RepID=UPI00295B2107|nr:3-oxo-5-alpha-steroid 4-dehydrogenase 1 [Anolis sagrei ordinatus]
MGSLVAAALSAEFWRGLSGPEEARLLARLSWGLVGGLALMLPLSNAVGMPYGRYSSPYFGLPIPATAAWILQESPSCLVPVLLVLCSDGAQLGAWPNRILLGLFLCHYSYRSFIFPFLIRGGKPTPFVTCFLAFVFCSYNGYLQGRSLSNYANYPSDWLTDPRFILGLIAWMSGLTINIHSDHILRTLRKPGETGYKIPRGGMFEYVTAANYFGEVLEWFGFALACCTIESAAFAISTLMILGLRSYKHHEWYHKKFDDYPRNRKRLIPYLF